MFDPNAAFRRIAKRLNAMKPDPDSECFFELMSGGLIWTDEQPSWWPADMDMEELGSLRILWNYRTSLILEVPRAEFDAVWNFALELAPEWPGFLPERREPRDDLLALIPKPKFR